MIKILMVGGNPLFIEGVESLICREVEAEIVGRLATIESALERLVELHPDVVILDWSDPGNDPGRIVSSLLKRGMTTKVLGLNLHDNSIYIYRGEQRTVRGIKDLVEAIQI